jgi:hypothetical protein
MAAAEDRTGNQAVFALFVSPFSSSLISAPSSVFTRRGFAACGPPMAMTRSAHSSPGKELTDGDDVLIIKMPDLFRQAHRLKEMDVRPDQPAGCGPANSLNVTCPCGWPPSLPPPAWQTWTFPASDGLKR